MVSPSLLASESTPGKEVHSARIRELCWGVERTGWDNETGSRKEQGLK